MRRGPTALLLLFATACAGAGGGDESQPASPPLCSDSWYEFVERTVGTGDGLGHGPTPGSDEWKGTVEFRLGIRGNPEVPARDSEAWCRHIDAIVRTRNG
jgi:hypothetical protein